MRKKYWIAIIVFVFVSLALLAASLWYVTLQDEKNVRGEYIFANTRKNIQSVSRLQMTTPGSGEINIYYDNGVWRFKEAAGYFINPEMLAYFYNMVNNSIIMTVNDGDFGEKKVKSAQEGSEAEQGTEVVVYDGEGKVLDDVIIGRQTENENYYFARKAGGHYVYGISSVDGFSGDAAAWIPFPLLEIKNSMLEALVMERKLLDREKLDILLQHSELVRKIVQVLNFVSYDGIALRTDFFENYPKVEARQIKAITSIGLVYVLDVYKADDVYWLAVRLDTTKIPRKEVVPFVAQNQKYFADWVFQMDEQQGAVLYETRLF